MVPVPKYTISNGKLPCHRVFQSDTVDHLVPRIVNAHVGQRLPIPSFFARVERKSRIRGIDLVQVECTSKRVCKVPIKYIVLNWWKWERL